MNNFPGWWPYDKPYAIMDCLEGMKQLPDKCVDLIVTSPPYNVGIDYGTYKDNKEISDYENWLNDIWVESERVLVDGGRLSVNVNDIGRNPYYPLHSIISIQMAKIMILRANIIWDKGNCLSNTAWGSYCSATNPSFRGRHEFIIVASKGSMSKEVKENDINGVEFIEYINEIWTFTPETNKIGHPAPYPVQLPMRLIKLLTGNRPFPWEWDHSAGLQGDWKGGFGV